MWSRVQISLHVRSASFQRRVAAIEAIDPVGSVETRLEIPGHL